MQQTWVNVLKERTHLHWAEASVNLAQRGFTTCSTVGRQVPKHCSAVLRVLEGEEAAWRSDIIVFV